MRTTIKIVVIATTVAFVLRSLLPDRSLKEAFV
jgi:hypothetical protein